MSSVRLAHFALAAVAAVFLGSCVTATWNRERSFAPPPDGWAEVMVPGQSNLTEALGLLGAPVAVREGPNEGVALAYASQDTRTFGVRVSVPLARFASANFSYADAKDTWRGVLLLFDKNLDLVQVAEGQIGQLLRRFTEARPAAFRQ